MVYGEEQLTYRDLDRQANQLAHLLIEKGIGPDKAVAIGIERSLHLPIALLAVLKAGGAIVPLDLDAPVERNRHMLTDSEASICLINTNKLPIPEDVALLIDVSQPETYTDKPMTVPQSQVGPDHFGSYLLYVRHYRETEGGICAAPGVGEPNLLDAASIQAGIP